jgi:beta-glucosidase
VGREISALVAAMTIDERASLTAGASAWSTAAVPRVGIPEVFVSDGPAGARGPMVPSGGQQVSTLNIPCGAALGATWNPALLTELGVALGDQTRTKACRVLLAPTVNLHRAPLAGRNFESYSEDPFLTGKLAAAFIRGVQSQGVATTVKHFAGNEAEFERMTIDSVIDQRTLRELYLLPFELAVREGGSLGIMTSYNRLNGAYNTENEWLLQTILRDEWGFEGFVVTDWFAGGTTDRAARAGLDLEMPGPSRFYGRQLGQAVRDGAVDESLLDAAVTRLLTVYDRIGALDDEPREPIAVDREEHRVLARRAAAESMVLLKNGTHEAGPAPAEPVLPLDATTLTTLAVIGPNAERARIMGGGSAEVQPHYRISPLQALRERLGDRVQIVHAQGCDIDRTVPIISGEQLNGGFTVDMYSGVEFEGESTRRVIDSGRVLVLPRVEADVPRGPMSFRATGTYTPAQTGPHVLSMVELGAARVFVDAAVVFDGIANPTPAGDGFFGVARQELTATVEMTAGRGHVIDIEFTSTQRGWLQGVQIGCKPVPSPDLMDRAVAVAAAADAAIVVVGTNNDWETEGHDRDSMDLPGAQAELIRRVSAANPRTIVVVNAGAPIETASWTTDADAVLQVWFGGQEMANALVDVLFGETDPSGRLPTTFPERIEHTPSFGNFPGEHGQVRYGEGVLMGYRWYEARHLPVSIPFGHGLSYTSFAIGTPRLSTSAISFARATGDADLDTLSVVVPVTNTGDRRGAEVVQCYVGAVSPAVVRPPKELKAFQKVWLEPGETRSVTLTLDGRAFAYWNPGNAYTGQLAPDQLGFFGAPAQAAAGWQVDPGAYRIHIGRSSADIAHVLELEVMA